MIKRFGTKIVILNLCMAIAAIAVAFITIVAGTWIDMRRASTVRIREVAESPEMIYTLNDLDILRRSCAVFVLSPSGEVTEEYGVYNGFGKKDYTGKLLTEALESKNDLGTLQHFRIRYCCAERADGGHNVALANLDAQDRLIRSISVRMIRVYAVPIAALLILNFFFCKFALRPAKQAWLMQKEFTENSSHELKTPLTVITTNAELLCSEGQSEEDKRQFARNILLEAKRMRELVGNMLDLARADSNAIVILFKKLDLGQLVEDVLMPLEPLFYEAGLELVEDIDSDIYVNGSEMDLSRAVSVLLDNALKYSSPSTPVIVRLKPHRFFKCRLSVSGCGEAMSEKELQDIFKRFYRCNNSHDGNSYGLGLPIARLIVNKHGGSVWAESKDNINTFYIELPRKR